MRSKITKTSVQNAKPKINDEVIWDTELSGFGLKVTPKGRKVFIYQYRTINSSKTSRVTIGRYLDRVSHKGKDLILSVRVAREKAEILRGRIKSGFDPKSEKRKDLELPLVNAVLDEFVKAHVEVRTKIKPRTAHEYKTYIRKDIKPYFKGRRLADISRRDIANLHVKHAEQPCKANHIFAILSKFFNWCEEYYHRPDGSNPCRHVKKYKIEPKERFLTKSEDYTLSQVLNEAGETGSESLFTIAAIQLLRFTGARKSEILTLKWEWVDFENNTLNLPDSKTGKKRIHLNSKALEILSAIPRIQNNPFVCVGSIEGTHLVNIQKAWSRIREQAGLSDVRIHDLRHTFASFAVGNGMSLHTVGMLLGHKQPSTTYRYAHLADSKLKEANEEVSRYINL